MLPESLANSVAELVREHFGELSSADSRRLEVGVRRSIGAVVYGREGLPLRSRYLRLKLEVTLRDGDYCAWCSSPLGGRGTLDHVIPKSRGGGRWLDNVVLSCLSCNEARASCPARIFAARCRLAGLSVRDGVIEAALARAREYAPPEDQVNEEVQLSIFAVPNGAHA